MRRAAMLVLLAACGGGGEDFARVEVADVSANPTGDLDVLLLVDNSPTTADFQANLGAGIASLLGQLTTADGARADLHIGVATSDLGTSGSTADAPGPAIGTVGQGGCAGFGKHGLLSIGQATAADLTGAFLSDGVQTNYVGDLAAVLQKMVMVGAGGCGFEQHLRGVQAALATDALGGTNPSFRRSGAGLAVLVLADEDDCSVRDPALLEADTARFGPLQSFRCTKFGVACDESLDAVGAKTNCRADTHSQLVEDPAVTAAALAALVPDPGRLAVASLVAPATPFAIEERAPTGGGQQILALAHSCAYEGTPDAGNPTGVATADPAVRLAAWAQSFASRGAVESMCSEDLSPQLQRIGALFRRTLGVACIAEGIPHDDCDAVDERGAAFSACSGAATDCFEIVTDAAACPLADHARIVIHRTAAPAGAHVVVRCRPA